MGGPGSGRLRGTGGRQRGARGVLAGKAKIDFLADLHRCYLSLGGYEFLRQYAASNPEDFCKILLMKLIPAAPVPEPAEPASLAPIGSPELLAVARRIAFILSRAAVPPPSEMIEMSAPEPAFPHQAQDPPLPPLDEAPVHEPPMPKSRERIEEPQGPEDGLGERFYRGSAAEQGRSRAKPDVIDQRRKAHEEYISRLAARHRRDLL